MCYLLGMENTKVQNILNEGFTHSIKDPLWQNIKLTSAFKALLEVKEVQKLARIKQTGPAYHIYPGAVHTRLSHSLGVYYLGREILLSLATKSEELPFTEKGIMSFLCSCLLHDIGHFPFAHALKELSIREHEEIAASLIRENEELNKAVLETGADPDMTADIIDSDSLTNNEETLFYRGLLSGTLDPDKLDYLSRDGFFSGVPYGKQDTDYIISSMIFKNNTLLIDEKASSSVEQILFSKYMMYKALYWHKGVRSATSMIKKALIIALKDGTITYDDLYGLDDATFYNMAMSKVAFTPALIMVDRVEHNNLEERKAVKDYDEKGNIETKGKRPEERIELENKLFSILKEQYPTLESWEVIIDIPEPINFESHIQTLDDNGNIKDITDGEMIFTGEVSTLFQKSLRKVSLYLPSYVSAKDAEKAMRSIIYA